MIAHEFISAFSLGVILNEGIHNIWVAIVLIITFSFAAPVGIAIGLGISVVESPVSKFL
jgi:hypothetical protein